MVLNLKAEAYFDLQSKSEHMHYTSLHSFTKKFEFV